MSNKFPDRQPEQHEMKHIGGAEFFCPICYRQVRVRNGRIEVIEDENGKPLTGDIFATHHGQLNGLPISGLNTNSNTIELDENVWGDALDGVDW